MFKPIFSAKRSKLVNVKIVQASLSKSSSGKPEFHKMGQAFVDVTEATADVYYIPGVVQKKWGKEYVLVT